LSQKRLTLFAPLDALQPQTESQGLYLIHASFGVGLLSLEWRCWDAAAESMRMAASFASIVPSSQAHGHTLKQHDLLQLVSTRAGTVQSKQALHASGYLKFTFASI